MKTQEIIEYHLFDPLGKKKPFITDSYNEAESYFNEGWAVTEFHTFRWQTSSLSVTSTTVTEEWN
jgi:hypothetical protein